MTDRLKKQMIERTKRLWKLHPDRYKHQRYLAQQRARLKMRKKPNAFKPASETKQEISEPKKQRKDLHITYVFFETIEAVENLLIFMRYGLSEDTEMTLVVKDQAGIKNKTLLDDITTRKNVLMVNIENIGYDFRGYLYSLNLIDFDKYEYFILMNSGCIGPFYRGPGKWYDVFIEKITDKIKVIGTNVTSIIGPGKRYKGDIPYKYRRTGNLSWGGWFCFADNIGIKILHMEYKKYNILTFQDAHSLESMNGNIIKKAGYSFTGLRVKMRYGLNCKTTDPYKEIIFKRKYNRMINCQDITNSLNIIE